jgi:hypothetical protein
VSLKPPPGTVRRPRPDEAPDDSLAGYLSRRWQAVVVTQEADGSWPYYTLDFPGLSRDDAERILDWVKQQGPALSSLLSGQGVSPGILVEPHFFYARWLDSYTVRSLKRASEIALATGQLDDQEAACLTSMVEDFAEWLEQAADDDDSGDETSP